MKRICSECGEEKDISNFTKFTNSLGKNYFRRKCKNCSKISQKEYYEKNKEEISQKSKERYHNNPEVRERTKELQKQWRKNHPGCRRKEYFRTLARKFDCDVEYLLGYYDSLYSIQNGKCAICGKFQKTLCLDHNHETGQLRELLCRDCNYGIGCLKHSALNCFNASEYLGKWNSE